MKVSRTDIFANVVYEKVYKDEQGKIVQETLETQIPKCSTKEKASIVLTKENKDSLISIVSISYTKRRYEIGSDVFYTYAKLVKEEEYEPTKNKEEV